MLAGVLGELESESGHTDIMDSAHHVLRRWPYEKMGYVPDNHTSGTCESISLIMSSTMLYCLCTAKEHHDFANVWPGRCHSNDPMYKKLDDDDH